MIRGENTSFKHRSIKTGILFRELIPNKIVYGKLLDFKTVRNFLEMLRTNPAKEMIIAPLRVIDVKPESVLLNKEDYA